MTDRSDADRCILRDGTSAIIRPALSTDREALRAFFERLAPASKQQRFFSQTLPSAEEIDSLADSSNPQAKLTLLVLRFHDHIPQIIAAGSYVAMDAQRAEVSFAVADEFQDKGLGTLLLEQLAIRAVQHGFVRFWAMTHADNRSMREVFRESGFAVRERLEGGDFEIDLAVLPSQTSMERSEMRDRVATVASLRPLFRPRSVAVIGASRNPSSIGRRILDALVMNRFSGTVYAVNPKASMIGEIQAYPSVHHLPAPVDLAIIAIPREAVLGVVDGCAERGVKALVVISSGFAEADAEGRDMQRRLVEKVRGYGMRLVGPNCLGLLNTDPEIRLNASFSPVFPPHGRVAMASQSGALGLALVAAAGRFHLGLSSFVSMGNKADISSNDLLQYWEQDRTTDVILLYLESFGNPRRFARIARRVSRRKPIIAVKGGRTPAGQRAAGSHTAALASSDVAVDALFQQTGILRAETLEEMFDLAALLGAQPLPLGRNVAIVSNAGGPAILCADTCEAGGLTVPEFSERTKQRLNVFVSSMGSVRNPVDLIASATPEQFQQAIETVLRAEEIDALVVIYIPVWIAATEAVAKALCEGVTAARKAGIMNKPVLACLMAEQGIRTQFALPNEQIPCFAFPEAPARALSKAVRYGDWRAQPAGVIPEIHDIDLALVRDICTRALAKDDAAWLSVEETRRILGAMRLSVPPGGVAKTADEAGAIARTIGFPVAVKVASHRILHKTDIGGVRLNVTSEAGVRQAFEDIRDNLAKHNRLEAMEAVLVQRMISGGVELLIGATEDPVFGPLIAFGLGGVHVEILGDVCFRVTPLTDRDANEMIRGIRGYRLLEGYRGHPPADVAAIQEALLRISCVVEEVPEIRELDLNPVFALAPGEGCQIVDARIRVHRG